MLTQATLSNRIRSLRATATAHWQITTVLLLCFGLYTLAILHTYPAQDVWVLDIMGGIRNLTIDDALRYYFAQEAWRNPSIWSWVYILPSTLLYDGINTLLTLGNITLMRLVHALTVFTSLVFLYRSLLLLDIKKSVSAMACTVCLAMPLFFLVTISFYGESLLTALIPAVIYCHLRGHENRLALLVATATLTQPEGLFLLYPFFIYKAYQRDWTRLFIMVAPGSIYFVFILYAHAGVSGYLNLHLTITELYKAFDSIMQHRGSLAPLITFNSVLVLTGLIGLLHTNLPKRTGLMLFVGMVTWALFYTFKVQPLQGYEARFYIPCVPAIALGCVTLLSRITLHIKNRPIRTPLIIFILAAILFENLGQWDFFRAQFLAGQRWPVGSEPIAQKEFFRGQTTGGEDAREMARAASYVLFNKPNVKLLVVSDFAFFYYLKPSDIPADAAVCFSPFLPANAAVFFEAKIFCMSSHTPQSVFYYLEPYQFNTAQGLFVGNTNANWQLLISNEFSNLYRMSYRVTSPPDKIRLDPKKQSILEARGKDKGDLCPNDQEHVCPNWASLSVF